MIHAYDQWLLMPVRDLYDTQMMLASIGAAKDMYEKAEKRIEDFKKEYSDFVTPFPKDQAEYNKMMAKVYGVINDAYARGEDPLRSAEGQLIIQQAINQMDPAKVAAMRANAKYGVPYGQSRDELLAKGMYDKGYEDYVLGQMGLPSYEDFSTVDNNGNIRMWNMSAAPAYQSMRDFSEPLYKNVKEHDATQADVESFGMTYDPRFKYEKTITRDDLINATKDNILGVENTMRYEYERQRIAQALLLLNNGEAPTEEQLNEAVINYFVNSNLDRLKRPDWDWDKMYTARWSAAHSSGGKRGRKSSGGSRSNSDTESFSDARWLLMRGTANILNKAGIVDMSYPLRGFSQEAIKYANGVSSSLFTYDDFDPDLFGRQIVDAQKQIANSVYSITDNLFEGPQFKFSPKKNKKFIDNFVLDYGPTKFAKWTDLTTADGDKAMINISNNEAEIRRLYSIDEIATKAAGVNAPNIVTNGYSAETNKARNVLGSKNGNNLFMKGGQQITITLNDGSTHIFQQVLLYRLNKKETNEKQTFTRINDNDVYVEKMLYDMGITTYKNPTFGDDNTFVNLYLDENVDADRRTVGDAAVLEHLRIGSPKINSTIAYPQLPINPDYEEDEEE